MRQQSVNIYKSDFSVRVCKHTKLRLATVEDSNFILQLRLDRDLNKYVSAVDDDLEKQHKWMELYKEREKNREEFYFIIESIQGDSYGAVRLYDFKGKSFCWGSWMIKRHSPAYASIESALSVYEFAFYMLGFEQSHFDVRKGNNKVVKFHEKFGAKHIYSDLVNYYFNLEKEDYELTKQRYTRFFAH